MQYVPLDQRSAATNEALHLIKSWPFIPIRRSLGYPLPLVTNRGGTQGQYSGASWLVPPDSSTHGYTTRIPWVLHDGKTQVNTKEESYQGMGGRRDLVTVDGGAVVVLWLRRAIPMLQALNTAI